MALVGAQFVNAVSPNPVGSLQAYAGASAPTGWLLCDGSEQPIGTYAELYSVLGTTYGTLTNGSGSAGSTHFRLPDLRGRMPIGAGNDASAENGATRTRGSKGGDTRMPQHSHQVRVNSFAGDRQIAAGPLGADGDKYSFSDSGNDASTSTALLYAANSGSGTGDNMPPFLVTNYIIKAVPDAPRSGLAYGSTPPIVTALPSNPQFGEQVSHRFTFAGTTYTVLKQWDGTAWVTVGSEPSHTWVAPTFQNSWTNYGGQWQTARYTRTADGIVHVQGLVSSGTMGATIFTLPAGYRPSTTSWLIFPVQTNPNTIGRVNVTNGGEIICEAGSNSWVSLSGISFPAAA